MSDKEGNGRRKNIRPPTVASLDFACLSEAKRRLSQTALKNSHSTAT